MDGSIKLELKGWDQLESFKILRFRKCHYNYAKTELRDMK